MFTSSGHDEHFQRQDTLPTVTSFNSDAPILKENAGEVELPKCCGYIYLHGPGVSKTAVLLPAVMVSKRLPGAIHLEINHPVSGQGEWGQTSTA